MQRASQGRDPQASGDGRYPATEAARILLEEAVKLGIKLPSFEKYGVGVVLFPKKMNTNVHSAAIF
ncbi:hypothetical protein O9992_12010 [Vibrio lentus]|nr:hypothetical protein [Vibrio lentus]